MRPFLKYPDKKTRFWAEQLLDGSRQMFSAWHLRDEMTNDGCQRSMSLTRDRFLEDGLGTGCAASQRYDNVCTMACDAIGCKSSESLTVGGNTYPCSTQYHAANPRLTRTLGQLG